MENDKLLKKIKGVFDEIGFKMEKAIEMDKTCCSYFSPCFGFFTENFGTIFIGIKNFSFIIDWNNVEQALLWKRTLPISFSHLFKGRPNNNGYSIQVYDLDDVKDVLQIIKDYIEEEICRQAEQQAKK